MLSITLQSLTPTPPAEPAVTIHPTLPERWRRLPAEIAFEAQSMLALYLRTTASTHRPAGAGAALPHGYRMWH